MNEEVTKTSSSLVFSYKSPREHVQGVLARWRQILGLTIGAFGILWTFGEAAILFTESNPRGLISYVALIGASFLIAIVWNVFDYMNHVPEGLGEVCPDARRIAHLQRVKWEFRFAQSVLAQFLHPIDRECRDLLDGKVFVPSSSMRDVRSYYSWMSSQPRNLLQLLDVARRVIVVDFPARVFSTVEKHATPKAIIDVCVAVQRIYREAVEFERSIRGVHPPEHFEHVHSLQIGWSQPIREAVIQLFDLLERLCDAEIGHDTDLNYTIIFHEPPNVDEFCRELEKLESLIPDILADEW